VVYTTGPLPYDVWSVPVSGGTPRLMMANAGTLTWTGDGRVMFGEVRGVPHMAIVTATEGRRELRDVYVPPTTSGMAHRAYLAPDKKWVLIAEMDTAGQGWLPCRLAPFDGGSPGRPVGPEGAPCTSAAWSPDGRWMYLSAAPAGGSYHIWRQRFPDGTPEQLTFGPTHEEGIAMAADGRSLVTSVGGAQSTLSIRDDKGERKIDTEATVTSPRFSADGSLLFYVEQKQLRDLDRLSGELWVVNVATGQRHRVMPELQVVNYALSPDARSVAAAVLDADGNSQLWVAPVDRDGSPTRVPWATPVNAAVFNPTGGLFILVREGASQCVYLTDPNGGNAHKVIADTVTWLIGVSPSGKWLLVRAKLPGGPPEGAGVVAYPVNGGTPVAVFTTMWSMARWAPDGRSLYMEFERHDTPEVMIASVPVSAEHELPELPPGGLKSAEDAAQLRGAKMIGLGVAASPDIAGVAVSPDFSKVAVVRTAVHRNLYRVPLP
jgi:Tol biopolymer transport system component